MRGIKNIDAALTFILNENISAIASESLAQHIELAVKDGWLFFAVNSRRGFCTYTLKTVTIPVWAINKGKDHATWYIAHELAHIYAGYKAHHGPQFQAQLARICPIECQHFEYGYKPRNAKAAGLMQLTAAELATL